MSLLDRIKSLASTHQLSLAELSGSLISVMVVSESGILRHLAVIKSRRLLITLM